MFLNTEQIKSKIESYINDNQGILLKVFLDNPIKRHERQIIEQNMEKFLELACKKNAACSLDALTCYLGPHLKIRVDLWAELQSMISNENMKFMVPIIRAYMHDNVSALGMNLLHYTIEAGTLEQVAGLLDLGLDVNVRDNVRNTPLHWAVYMNNVNIVELLLENKAVDINARNNRQQSVLELAAEGGCFKIVKLLLEHGAHTRAANENDVIATWGQRQMQSQPVGMWRQLCSPLTALDYAVNGQSNVKSVDPERDYQACVSLLTPKDEIQVSNTCFML